MIYIVLKLQIITVYSHKSNNLTSAFYNNKFSLNL